MRITENEEKIYKQSPFNSFYQVNKDNADYLEFCLHENPKALSMLLFLFKHMDKYNALMCSYKVFQEALKMSRATVTRCIQYLRDNGYIYIYKSGTSNVYVANPSLVWSSWGNNKEYCKFPANIILSKSEQEQLELARKKLQLVEEA